MNETICAYLNTNGGYIICGIREKNKSYKITEFDRNNESKLIETLTRFFKNDFNVLIDLSDNIHSSYKDFLEKTIAIITIIPSSED